MALAAAKPEKGQILSNFTKWVETFPLTMMGAPRFLRDVGNSLRLTQRISLGTNWYRPPVEGFHWDPEAISSRFGRH
jgi:hypothetical protein